MSGQENIQQREHLARIAMREALENQKAEDSVELFIQHHLEEIEPSYWEKHTGTQKPTVLQVLDLLVVDNDGDDSFQSTELIDFSLPDEITNYVLCVSFDKKGDVIDISMES
jgi:hypothetical protein